MKISISLFDLDDRYAILWANERSRLPSNHPSHISQEARDLIFSRALRRMERQVDAMIAAMLRELGRAPPDWTVQL